MGTGIIRNFHLLNFEIKNTNEKIQPLNNDPVFQKMDGIIVEINPDIKNIISDKLLKKWHRNIMLSTKMILIVDDT